MRKIGALVLAQLVDLETKGKSAVTHSLAIKGSTYIVKDKFLR
jgi:hypothetical protein